MGPMRPPALTMAVTSRRRSIALMAGLERCVQTDACFTGRRLDGTLLRSIKATLGDG